MKTLLRTAYQAVVNTKTRSTCYWEALTRVTDDQSYTAHGELIQLAERCGFIHNLDLSMATLVLAETAQVAIDDPLQPQYAVAINLSPLTIEKAPRELCDLIEQHPTLARRLIIEVTETMPIEDLPGLQDFIAYVRALGVRIALDDYGAGCITEQLVRRLRPEFLKISGEMLRRTFRQNDTLEWSRAHDLVSEFGGELIAEQVDTTEKFHFLNEMGISLMQGALFGMPDRRKPVARQQRYEDSPLHGQALPQYLSVSTVV